MYIIFRYFTGLNLETKFTLNNFCKNLLLSFAAKDYSEFNNLKFTLETVFVTK